MSTKSIAQQAAQKTENDPPVEEVTIVYHGIDWNHSAPASSDPEWKYVPVRRVAATIEEDLSQGIEWAVFAPNTEPTWDEVGRAPIHTPDWTDFNDSDPATADGGESVVPGSGLMENMEAEEDELQTLPADKVMGDGGLGPDGPDGPGPKTDEVFGDSGLGPVPGIGAVAGDAGVSPLPGAGHSHDLTLKRGYVEEAAIPTADEFVFAPVEEDAAGMYPGAQVPTPIGPNPSPVPIPYPTVPTIPSDGSDAVTVEEVDAFWFG